MQVYCNLEILKQNRDKIKNFVVSRDMQVAFMIKKQFLQYEIMNVLANDKVYSTAKYGDGNINIYDNENIVIVDAYERREGITLQEAEKVKNKHTAIVNFYCCEGTIPKEIDLLEITLKLREMGYRIVSLGGSMLMDYQYAGYDEIRVGEAFLTGYSTVTNRYFEELENPFSVELNMLKEDRDRVVLKHGFLEVGGFTDVKTVCVNTDFTVIQKDIKSRNENDGKLILKPDYYTLIKLAHNGDLDNVKYRR